MSQSAAVFAATCPWSEHRGPGARYGACHLLGGRHRIPARLCCPARSGMKGRLALGELRSNLLDRHSCRSSSTRMRQSCDRLHGQRGDGGEGHFQEKLAQELEERSMGVEWIIAPVSHQKRPDRNATNTTESERKDSKINEADRYSAAHNGLVAGSSPAGPTSLRSLRELRLGKPNPTRS
jgi:hypothetical protein